MYHDDDSLYDDGGDMRRTSSPRRKPARSQSPRFAQQKKPVGVSYATRRQKSYSATRCRAA